MKLIKKSSAKLNEIKIKEYSQKFNLDEKVVKLLFLRGYSNEQKIAEFLRPNEQNFHNPFLLKNMKELVEKINFHIKNNHKIVIIGDYDTDGISASAIMYKLFVGLENQPFVFLPHRIADGYGLSIETIDKVYSLYNPDFIITVDCGISAKIEVDYAKKLGIDIAVTDHHEIPEILPDCIVVNPKLEGQKYPFKELCGAGVAFKVAEAVLGLEKAKRFLTIASIATVADIVPLVDENRAIVYLGLKNQERDMPTGIKILLQKLKINTTLSSTDISFRLAPKLNASGRMGDAIISFNLYILENRKQINENINILLEMNEKRLAETNSVVEQAQEMLKNTNISKVGVIVLYNDNWESGVLGIICSRLVEIYNRPVCVLTKLDGVYKGSIRSIPSINIFQALSSIKHVLVQYGGHSQAAGVTIEEDKLEEFIAVFNDYITTTYAPQDFTSLAFYDFDLTKENITKKFVESLNKLEPYGLENEKPLFKLSFNVGNVRRMPKHFNHIKLLVNNLEIIGFNMGEYYHSLSSNCNKNVLIELNLEEYKGKTKINGLIKSLRFSELKTPIKSDYINASYLMQLKHILTPSLNNYEITTLQLKPLYEKITNETTYPFGSLVIANSFESYDDFIKNNKTITNFYLYEIKDYSGENAVIFSPNNLINFKNYNNIYFLDPPIHMDYINNIANNNARIYIANKKFDLKVFEKLSISREVFAKYHVAIKNACKENLVGGDFYDYYDKLKKMHSNLGLNFVQFVFVVLVLEELQILNVFETHITINESVTSKLHKSKIYNFINLISKDDYDK